MSKVPILVSFAYMKNSLVEILNANKDRFEIILDSGAYTAFNTGRTISLDDYMAFLKDLPFPVEFYFTLDSIGNPATTESNLLKLYERGYKPVPVFTRGQVRKDFERYSQTGLVGVGGIAGTDDNMSYLSALYRDGIITDKDKVHWLGFWDRDYVLHFRPYSCDTQSWMSAARFGRAWIYENRKLVTFSRANCFTPAVKRFCDRYSIDVGELKQDRNWRWDKKDAGLSQIVQALAALEYVKMIREKIGTRIYLACSGNQSNLEIKILTDCFQYHIRSENGNA